MAALAAIALGAVNFAGAEFRSSSELIVPPKEMADPE